MSLITWVENQKKMYPKANSSVLRFICRFREENLDLERIFTSGYCYYFAIMLQDAFDGAIYLSPENNHIVWSEDQNLYYDITGVCNDKIIKKQIVSLPKEKLKNYRKI